jgi:hypothetical protein
MPVTNFFITVVGSLCLCLNIFCPVYLFSRVGVESSECAIPVPHLETVALNFNSERESTEEVDRSIGGSNGGSARTLAVARMLRRSLLVIRELETKSEGRGRNEGSAKKGTGRARKRSDQQDDLRKDEGLN